MARRAGVRGGHLGFIEQTPQTRDFALDVTTLGGRGYAQAGRETAGLGISPQGAGEQIRRTSLRGFERGAHARG